MTTWNMMVEKQILPKDSKIDHILRSLHYMNLYEPFDAYTVRYRTHLKIAW